MEDVRQDAHRILKDYFGYDTFRPLQEEIIRTILQKKDALVLMPTGGGKSLCYQVPALMQDGVCLVVSPLIALMKDQVLALKANGISAAALNSTLSPQESAEVMRDCENGKIKLLYLSPEKLLTEISILRLAMKISFVAVDEAHCISSWGHDFRPEYTQLHKLRELLPGIPVMALTATADKVTRKDIITQLRLNDPAVFISSFNRPNISLSVRSAVTGKYKHREIVSFLEQHEGESGIIYCMSRKSTEELATKLRAEGFSIAYYHAGMPNDERDRVQEDFINDRVQIICATIAFGMGIDKSNVRWVIHYNMPKNMEGYYQEIGRAGRDGEKADALLFYNVGDLVFLTKIAQDSGQQELNLAKLQRIQQFAEAVNCRRKILLGYFGEALQENCGNCDVCNNPVPLIDGTVIAQMALSAAIRVKEEASVNLLIDVLRGSSKSEIFERGYHQIKTYGAGKQYSFREWQHYLLQLLNLGLFEMAYDEGFALKVTEYGREVVSGKTKIQLGAAVREMKPESRPVERRKLTVRQRYFEDLETAVEERNYKREVDRRFRDELIGEELDDEDSDVLFEKLRRLRLQIAKDESVPPYVVFSDASLRDMIDSRPTSPIEMLAVSGVGQKKMEQYGIRFINAIREHERMAPLEGTVSIPVKAESPKREKGSTYKETLRLYQEGKTVDAIAAERQLNPVTIWSHIVLLCNDGKIDPKEIVPEEIVSKVRAVLPAERREKMLSALFVALEEKVPFHIIRLALVIIDKSR